MSKRKRQPVKGPPKPEPQQEAPKRKARRTPITHNSGVPLRTQIVHDDSSVLGLRYAAGRDYVCTFRDVSVAELAQRPMYRGINVRRMQHWCGIDNWVEKRREWREEYRKAMERAIGTQLIQTRREYMKRAEGVLDMLMGKLLPEEEGAVMLEPSSLESLANATRQWWRELIEEKKELADAILPEPIAVQAADTTSIVKPELSQEETRAAAAVIVRMRRERMRAALEANQAKKEGEEEQKPHMRVIDGEK